MENRMYLTQAEADANGLPSVQEQIERHNAAIRLLKADPNVSQAFREAIQPHYTDCKNCGGADHSWYRCPCACHNNAIQRPLPGADFRALTRRDEEPVMGQGHSDDLADYSTGGK